MKLTPGVSVGATGALLKVGGGIHGGKVEKALEELTDAIKNDVEAYELLKEKLKKIETRVRSSEKLKFTVLKGLVKSPGQALLNLTTYATAAGIEKMF